MKVFLELLAFILLSAGFILLLKLNLKEFLHDVSKAFLWNPQKTLKTRVLEVTGKKKGSRFLKLIQEAVTTLEVNKKESLFPLICGAALVMSLLGILLGFLMQNYFIAPVLGAGFLICPFLYVKLLGFRLKKLLNQELESTLSIVTTSYCRSENIVEAVEENISYINAPIKEVFQQFLFEAKMVNPDIKKLIRRMRDKINNNVFKEWCDALASCQDNSKLKSTLLPITKKLSTVRTVSARLDAMLYEPVKEFISLIVMVVLNIPLMYFINKEWYRILVYSQYGKITLSVCAAIIFVSVFAVIKITRPIEYKR
ncbi:type II secretion system F family protein [[Clostridium] polysaccharolyticum]|uniref:Tight adherence protein B n=1 Tax=[Clostridium] polysaccharolyticum TaxID=29364 RepID=A0A1H9Y8Z9_9FIRM|nr:hypothetical protein [[Clostridium] polysaccharolyticum]SES65278.1 tight adherence protein B [[Clostridium] polysaccharolyticum]